MSASKIFLYFCLSFIIGIFISPLIIFSLPLFFGVLIFGIFLISVTPSLSLGNKKIIITTGFCLLFLAAGIWRNQIFVESVSKPGLKIFNDINEKINLKAVITNQPEKGEKTQKFTVEAETLNEDKIKGKVLITTNLYPEYKYGEKLNILGELKAPSFNENYREYLAKGGIFSEMAWPKIEKTGEYSGNIVISALFYFKEKFKETTRKFVSPPQQGLLEALFFGDEENISKEWKDKINLVGVRHIAAVSGMNITIISSLILSFILGLGFWRKQAFYASLVLIILYILMIGAPASAVRAGIFGGLFMIGQQLGRLSTASRAIVFAASLMLFFNPLLLRFDVGFQLSFLAMFGIIYLQPILSGVFRKIPNPLIFPVKTALSSTIAAQIFTLPILIYNFGYISAVSPITNILIVPLLAPLTVLIFIFGIAGILFLPLGYIFSWLAWLGLTYIVFVIDFFSKISFTKISIQNTGWLWILIYYLALFLFILWQRNNQRLKFLNY